MRKLFSMRTLFLALLFLVPAASRAQVSLGVSVHVGPPALPVYEQPHIIRGRPFGVHFECLAQTSPERSTLL
jgi:hypothetical protein